MLADADRSPFRAEEVCVSIGVSGDHPDLLADPDCPGGGMLDDLDVQMTNVSAVVVGMF